MDWMHEAFIGRELEEDYQRVLNWVDFQPSKGVI